jgi:hypothetical protein
LKYWIRVFLWRTKQRREGGREGGMAGTVWRILIFTALLLALVFICFQMPHFYHYVEKVIFYSLSPL